jgi:hypothetical protein
MQVDGQGGAEKKYKGVVDVIKHLYKEGGIRSLYRGSIAAVSPPSQEMVQAAQREQSSSIKCCF